MKYALLSIKPRGHQVHKSAVRFQRIFIHKYSSPPSPYTLNDIKRLTNRLPINSIAYPSFKKYLAPRRKNTKKSHRTLL